jgi:hypothetical protein
VSEAESPFFPQISLENEAEVDAAFRLISERTDRRSLVDRLEDVLRQRGIVPGRSPVMACGTGGFAVVAMNALLLESLTSSRGGADYLPRIHRLAARLVEFYGFPPDWLPPRMLFREALALTIRRRQVIQQIERQSGTSPQLLGILDRAGTGLAAVVDAFLMPDDRVDELLEPQQHSQL